MARVAAPRFKAETEAELERRVIVSLFFISSEEQFWGAGGIAMPERRLEVGV